MKLYSITFLNGSVTTVSAEGRNIQEHAVFFWVGRETVATFFTHALVSIVEIKPS